MLRFSGVMKVARRGLCAPNMTLQKTGSIPARSIPKRIGAFPGSEIEQDCIWIAATVLRIDALAIEEGRAAAGKYQGRSSGFPREFRKDLQDTRWKCRAILQSRRDRILIPAISQDLHSISLSLRGATAPLLELQCEFHEFQHSTTDCRLAVNNGRLGRRRNSNCITRVRLWSASRRGNVVRSG